MTFVRYEIFLTVKINLRTIFQGQLFLSPVLFSVFSRDNYFCRPYFSVFFSGTIISVARCEYFEIYLCTVFSDVCGLNL